MGVNSLRVIIGDSFQLTTDSDHLYAFFKSLRNADYINFNEFEAHWSELPNNVFTKKQLLDILKWSADAIDTLFDRTDQIEAKNIISKYWKGWESLAIPHVANFGKKDCTLVLEACKKLKIRPSQLFTSEFNDRLRSIRDGLTAKEYSVIFQSAATLGLQIPPSLNDHFHIQAIRVPEFLKRTAKTPLLWSAAINDCLNPNEGFAETAKTIRKMMPRRARNHVAAAQRYHSALWFGWNAKRPNNQDKPRSSKSEQTFFNYLKGNQIPVYKHTQPIPELPQAVDLDIVTNGRIVLTELDGPTHYVNLSTENPYALGEDLDGLTKFRSALMAKEAPFEIIRRISTNTVDILTGQSYELALKGDTRLGLTYELLDEAAQSDLPVSAVHLINRNGRLSFSSQPILSQ